MATRDVTTIAMSTDHVMSRGQHHLTIVDAAAAQPFSDGHERRLHVAASDKIYYIASLFVSSVMRQYLTLCSPPLPYGYWVQLSELLCKHLVPDRVKPSFVIFDIRAI